MKHLLVCFGFALCSLLYLSPDIIFDVDRVLGLETRDLYDHLALLDQWSLRVDEWSHPTGGVLVPPDIFSMIFAFPFWGFGRGVAFDIALWIQLLLCCIGGYSVGRHVGSGLVGGLAFGFSPFILGQLFSGETETMNGWTMAFMLAVYLRNPHSLWVGFWLTMTALGSWYYGAYACICLAICTLFRGKWRTKDRDWRLLWPICFFAMLIAIPAGIYASILGQEDQLFRGPTMKEYLEVNPRALASFSVDPAVWFGYERVDVGHGDGFGLLVLLLAGGGLTQFIRSKRSYGLLLFGILLLSLLLSVGPILHWRSEPIFSWMPYRAFVELPILGLMRLPHRWLLVSSLVIALLAARGARDLPVMWLVLIGFEALYMNSAAVYSVRITPPSIIDLYKGPVLELPNRTLEHDVRGRYLLWQRYHRQPTAYSLLMQGWSPALDSEPLLVAIAAVDRKDPIAVRTVEAEQFRKGDFAHLVRDWQEQPMWGQLANSRSRIRDFGFQQVVLFREAMHEQDALEAQRILESVLGIPFVESAEVVLWKL